MYKKSTEITVGLFMVAGIAALVYLSLSLGNIEIFGSSFYRVTAQFSSIQGLKKGGSVEISGVKVGKVTDISLKDDVAVVAMKINRDVKLTDDSIASIRTNGIIGEKFIKITPGGSSEYLNDDGRIMETEASVSLEELVSKYIFEK